MSEGEAGRRTDGALEASGLADMRPAYRKLLVRLKQTNPAEFDEAIRRYREELEPSVASGDVDPIDAWLEYGRWLADRIVSGRALSIDRSGRARPFGAGADAGPHADLVLHLPDDDRTPAILLAAPRKPSEPQKLTADLLVR